jgi:hypothetical protein
MPSPRMISPLARVSCALRKWPRRVHTRPGQEGVRVPHSRRYLCHFCGVVLPVSPPATTLHEVALLLGHVRLYHPTDATRILAALPRTDSIALIISQAFFLVETRRQGGGLSPWYDRQP